MAGRIISQAIVNGDDTWRLLALRSWRRRRPRPCRAITGGSMPANPRRARPASARRRPGGWQRAALRAPRADRGRDRAAVPVISSRPSLTWSICPLRSRPEPAQGRCRRGACRRSRGRSPDDDAGQRGYAENAGTTSGRSPIGRA
jgi:hypothetical protein